MANRLKLDKKVMIVSMLVEGNSIRSIERMTGCHRDTIMRLGVRVGDGCQRLMDENMRDIDSKRIEVDEILAFVGKKNKNIRKHDDVSRIGDQYTFVAIDSDTKLVPSFRVGKRTSANANAFMLDLASRLRNRIQLSSDQLHAYPNAVEEGFGGDVDHGQIVKTYESNQSEVRYSPAEVVDIKKTVIQGTPDIDKISTSYVERQNLTMRMHCRRLTRLTNAFSKKLENFKAAVALHFAYYNYCKTHSTLRATPAMAAGLAYTKWSVEDLIKMTDEE